MSDVPSEIVREILLRLPAESLFRLRSVCKKWQRIIGDPSFIKAHTKNQLCSHTLLVRSRYGSSPFYSFSLDSLNFINGPQMIEATRIKQSIRHGKPLFPHLVEVASCNGLIFVSGFVEFGKVYGYSICNPLTREFHEFPNSSAASLFGLYGLGFGYDYVTDDYKVVKIGQFLSGRKLVYQTLIYSLKSESWRKIEDCHCSCIPRCGAFLNGTLCWISEDTIIALDLGTEIYSQLPLPPVDISEIRKMIGRSFSLDSLDGCLFCSLNYRTRTLIDGWVMKDNGVEKSWIILFSVQYSLLINTPGLRLVAYLKIKEQVVLQHDWVFLWLDIGNNSVKKFSIHGQPNIRTSKICPGSLVRLNGRAIGAKRKRTTKRPDTRLKFCVRNVEEVVQIIVIVVKIRVGIARKSNLERNQWMLPSFTVVNILVIQ